MFEIRSKKDLELAYTFVKWLSKETTNPKAAQKVVEMKREIRRCTKPVNDGRRIIHHGEDSYIELVELPEWLADEADASQYFEENVFIHYRPTYYDCTGQLFTSWYKIFRRNGRYMAYHLVCADV